MSDTPVMTLMLPALGGAAMVLGLGYGAANMMLRGQESALIDARAAMAEAATGEITSEVERLTTTLAAWQANPPAPGSSAPLPVLDPIAVGRVALSEEVAAWDIDIRPDGAGLPAGSGDVWTGEEVFADNCASCHGDFGEAVGRWPVLAGGHDTLDSEDPVKTIGSYWPYLSTVYDYINRAMPFGYAQSLEPDDVYAITAYLLYLNDLVEDDFELSHENFAEITLPNADNFYPDDRADLEYTTFSGEPCMSDCKDVVEITARARIIDVTPEEDTPPAASPVATPDPEETHDDASAGPDLMLADADVEYGEYLSSECTTCHQMSGANDGIPAITGWAMEDFAQTMHAYRTGERTHEVMQMIAGRLGAEEIAALAAYFESLGEQ